MRNAPLTFGGPITLAVVGAILHFAVADRIPNVDLRIIGVILMAAAAVWLLLGLLAARPRTHTRTETATIQNDAPTTPVTPAAPAANGDQYIEREVRHDGV